MINTPRRTNSPELQRFRANSISLFGETLGVFLIFAAMLALTGGKPPGWAIPVTFSFTTGFVVLAETRRELQFRKRRREPPEQTPAIKNSSQNDADSSIERERGTAEQSVLIQHSIQQSVPIYYLRNGQIKAWNEWRQRGIFVDFYRANLTRVNLVGANLTGVNLIKANLFGANLTRANLSGANLTRANLVGANLTGANLVGANLTRANLSGANLTGADLSGSSYREALVEFALFRDNSGLTDADKDYLKDKGALFQDSPGDRSPIQK